MMKVCPKCGNVADTNFCSKCGSAMEMVEGKETSLQEESIDESESENTNQEEQEVIKVMSPEENSVNNGISQKFNKEKHYGQGHKRQTTKRGLLTTNKG